jgi:hypothetical protein
MECEVVDYLRFKRIQKTIMLLNNNNVDDTATV